MFESVRRPLEPTRAVQILAGEEEAVPVAGHLPRQPFGQRVRADQAELLSPYPDVPPIMKEAGHKTRAQAAQFAGRCDA